MSLDKRGNFHHVESVHHSLVQKGRSLDCREPSLCPRRGFLVFVRGLSPLLRLPVFRVDLLFLRSNPLKVNVLNFESACLISFKFAKVVDLS